MSRPATNVRPSRRFRPGAAVEWSDRDGGTRAGVVAEDDGLMRDLQIGPPGGPRRSLIPVHADEFLYVDAEDLTITRGDAR